MKSCLRYLKPCRVTPTVIRRYDPAVAYGKGKLWQTETANTAQVTVANFDALGRPATLQQKFWQTGLADWNAAPAYAVSREYNLVELSGSVTPVSLPPTVGHYTSATKE